MQIFRNILDFFVRKEWVATVGAATLVLTEIADAVGTDVEGVTPQQLVITVVSVLVARFGVYSRKSYDTKG